jgi:hypothetical protein
VLTYVKTTMTPPHTSRVPKVLRRSRATPNGQTGTPADIHRRRQIPEYFIVTTTSASIWFDFDVNWSWSCGYYELHSRSLAACFPLWLFEVCRDARVPEMRTFIAYLQMAMLPVLFKMAAGIRHSIQQEWRLFPAGKMYFRYTFSYKHQLNCKIRSDVISLESSLESFGLLFLRLGNAIFRRNCACHMFGVYSSPAC